MVTAAIRYRSGVLGTFHMNSDCILDETTRLEIYGTEGILMPATRTSSTAGSLSKKAMGETIAFPYTHGHTEQSWESARRRWPGQSATGGRTGRPRKWRTTCLRCCTAFAFGAGGPVVEMASDFTLPGSAPHRIYRKRLLGPDGGSGPGIKNERKEGTARMAVQLQGRESIPAVIAEMTLEEKALLLPVIPRFSTLGIERLGIPRRACWTAVPA